MYISEIFVMAAVLTSEGMMEGKSSVFYIFIKAGLPRVSRLFIKIRGAGFFDIYTTFADDGRLSNVGESPCTLIESLSFQSQD